MESHFESGIYDPSPDTPVRQLLLQSANKHLIIIPFQLRFLTNLIPQITRDEPSLKILHSSHNPLQRLEARRLPDLTVKIEKFHYTIQ